MRKRPRLAVWVEVTPPKDNAPAPTVVDLAPGVFGTDDGAVLNWRGQNYTPQVPTLAVRVHNLVHRFRNRRSYA